MTRDDDIPVLAEVSAALAPILKRIKRLPPLDQIALCQELNAALLDGQGQLAAVRRSAVRQLRADGMTLRDIAKETGMSMQRIHQLEVGVTRNKRTLH